MIRPLALLALASASAAAEEPRGFREELRASSSAWRVTVVDGGSGVARDTVVLRVERVYRGDAADAGRDVSLAFDPRRHSARLQTNLVRGAPGWVGRFYSALPRRGDQCVALVRAVDGKRELANICCVLMPLSGEASIPAERLAELDEFIARCAAAAAAEGAEATGLLTALVCRAYVEPRLGEFEDRAQAALLCDWEIAAAVAPPPDFAAAPVKAAHEAVLTRLAVEPLGWRLRTLKRIPWLTARLSVAQRRELVALLLDQHAGARADLKVMESETNHGVPGCCGVDATLFDVQDYIDLLEGRMALAAGVPKGEAVVEYARKFVKDE